MKNTKYKTLALAAFILMYTGCKKTQQPVEENIIDENVFAIIDNIKETGDSQTEIDLVLENKNHLVLCQRDVFRKNHGNFLLKCKVGDTIWLLYDDETKKHNRFAHYDSSHTRVNDMNNFFIMKHQQKKHHGKTR